VDALADQNPRELEQPAGGLAPLPDRSRTSSDQRQPRCEKLFIRKRVEAVPGALLQTSPTGSVAASANPFTACFSRIPRLDLPGCCGCRHSVAGPGRVVSASMRSFAHRCHPVLPASSLGWMRLPIPRSASRAELARPGARSSHRCARRFVRPADPRRRGAAFIEEVQCRCRQPAARVASP